MFYMVSQGPQKHKSGSCQVHDPPALMNPYGSEDPGLKTRKLRVEGACSKALEYWHNRAQRDLRDHLLSFLQGHKLKLFLRQDAWGKVRSKVTGKASAWVVPVPSGGT